jgi:hypothetical protein
MNAAKIAQISFNAKIAWNRQFTAVGKDFSVKVSENSDWKEKRYLYT